MASLAKVVLTFASCVATVALLGAANAVSAAETAAIPTFSAQQAGAVIKGWTYQPIRSVKLHSSYALVRDEQTNAVVIEGAADSSAGALLYRFDADAHATPMLHFKWKVGNLLAHSDPKTKSGDDYAARIYVTFAHDPARETLKERAENTVAKLLYNETPPHAALTYVFTHKASLNDVITSPFTQRVKMLVVDADPTSVGQWKSFTRDVYEDYKRVFGEEPTRISGIAIMVDADNTHDKASARFGDISLSAKP